MDKRVRMKLFARNGKSALKAHLESKKLDPFFEKVQMTKRSTTISCQRNCGLSKVSNKKVFFC